MKATIPPRRFYARPTVEVARGLLGCVLEYNGRGGRIVEVEAYLPDGDEAAHAWRGRTARTEVLYGEPGHAYVFLNYGIHHCLNVVAEPEGIPGCVLIRGVEGLGDGPGKLTRAAGITLAENGCDLTRGPIVIRRGKPPAGVETSTRIGITRSADLVLRFVAKDAE
ncbi:MAG: DNA-3-methyladenine glycosylase [Candidatus Solibacter sp.]|nr:DNA-3-methyladenine glycosylase [Candidatus Solibacter sp.]